MPDKNINQLGGFPLIQWSIEACKKSKMINQVMVSTDSLEYKKLSEDIKKGDVLTVKNLRCVRPGMGLSPKYFDILIGKRVNQDIKKGTPMSWRLLE